MKVKVKMPFHRGWIYRAIWLVTLSWLVQTKPFDLWMALSGGLLFGGLCSFIFKKSDVIGFRYAIAASGFIIGGLGGLFLSVALNLFS